MNISYQNITLRELLYRYPHARDFFQLLGGILGGKESCTVETYFTCLDDAFLENCGFTREELPQRLTQYLAFIQELQGRKSDAVQSITIIGGQDKSGRPENLEITIQAGEIACIVGPTGSGKSRLLADIEWLAQGDTPTGRRILINGYSPAPDMRFAVEHKLVAQLSQNMNFIMDLSVREFIALHAESRMRSDVSAITENILAEANQLAGEPFYGETPVTALSGGQSRALMIADTAFLSRSPIVLIDEIENAGIDRQKALALLVNQQKIVLMATHDPFLALMGTRRMVIGNGGIRTIIKTTDQERANLHVLKQVDEVVLSVRQKLRSGERIEQNLAELFRRCIDETLFNQLL